VFDALRTARTPEYPDADEARYGVLEQFEPLGGEFRVAQGQPRDVSTGPTEAGYEPGYDGVTLSQHDDGNGLRGILGRSDRWQPRRHDHILGDRQAKGLGGLEVDDRVPLADRHAGRNRRT
jgi:hypothetical protein